MASVRANLEKLKQDAVEALQNTEASLRAAQARLSAFNDSIAALADTPDDVAKTALIRRLQEKIKKEQAETTILNDAVARARARCDGFDDVLRLLPRDGGDELRSGTAMYDVREVLRSAGHPMCLDEILKKLGLEEKRNSLRGSLASYAAKGRVFTKSDSAPETFGLIEFHSNTAKENT